MRRVAEEGVK
jgi:enoyl-CoA hydratase/carnithine racemase